MNCHLLIRADVGPAVGTGHVMRTAALAMAYKKIGGEATIACNSTLPGGLKSRLERQGISVVTLDPTSKIDDAIQTRQLAEHLEADWIVTDGYGYDDEYQHILKLSLAKLMVIDDFGHGSHRMADLVLNQNIYSDGSEYSLVPSEQVICGSRFVLLRNEFKNIKPNSNVSKFAKRILLTFGGADEHDFTADCLRVLGQTKSAQSFQVDVVLGACNPNAAQLKILSKTLPFATRIHRNVDRMSILMKQSDMAITAGGSTCYELARCGVPAIVVSLAENQRAVARSFSEHECMQWLGDAKSFSDDELSEAIENLANSAKRRRDMIKNGESIVDGNGAERIARRLISDQFTFREADTTDSEQILSWRNEPGARAASFQPDPVVLDEHQTWLRKTLASNLVDLWIVEFDDQPIGQVRFDFDPSGDEATVSVSLDHQVRGKNWGTTIIESACRSVFLNDDVETIVALIKPENIASINAFGNAGFIDQAPIAIHGDSAKRMTLTHESLLQKPNRVTPWKKSA